MSNTSEKVMATTLYKARRASVCLYTDTHIAVEATKDFWQ